MKFAELLSSEYPCPGTAPKSAHLLPWYSRRRPAIGGAMGFTRSQLRSVRLINGTLGGSVSARVANGGLARPARSLVLRGPGRRRLGQGEQGAG